MMRLPVMTMAKFGDLMMMMTGRRCQHSAALLERHSCLFGHWGTASEDVVVAYCDMAPCACSESQPLL
jgi:hypothetical protein